MLLKQYFGIKMKRSRQGKKIRTIHEKNNEKKKAYYRFLPKPWSHYKIYCLLKSC